MGKSFGEQLRERLESQQIKPAELARRSKVTKQNIGRLLHNTPHSVSGALPRPEPETVEKIARALNWDIDDALLAAGWAPRETETPGFFSGYHNLTPENQRRAQRLIKATIDSLAAEEQDTNYIDD